LVVKEFFWYRDGIELREARRVNGALIGDA